jgi:hypothetical protein
MDLLKHLGPAGPMLMKKFAEEFKLRARSITDPQDLLRTFSSVLAEAQLPGSEVQLLGGNADGKSHLALIVSLPPGKGLDSGAPPAVVSPSTS